MNRWTCPTIALALAACLVSAATPATAATKGYGGVKNVPDVYGEGVLFAFSGFDGNTKWAAPFVASTKGPGLGLWLHIKGDPVLRIQPPRQMAEAMTYRVVAGDVIVADLPNRPAAFVLVMAEKDIVAGRAPKECRVFVDGPEREGKLLKRKVGDATKFVFAHHPEGQLKAARMASEAITISLESAIDARMEFFRDHLPTPEGQVSKKRMRALAKACSIIKVNTYAPEARIETPWTTPDRWPHRDMWLWDSAFHSLGMMHVDAARAKAILAAVYPFQRDSGFIPHRMNPRKISDITQPPILGWAAWQVYYQDRGRDRQFLQTTFEVVADHVTWILKHRRLGGPPPETKSLTEGTPLYAWASGDESGADNSPRFAGGAGNLAAIDLSCYLANECRMLQYMAQKLGYATLAKTWGDRADDIVRAAREKLWDPDRKFFFDRTGGGSGELSDVWAHHALLTLWAGVATPEQAAHLVEHLKNEKKFWTPLPVPSVARDDPTFNKDMWQGPTWININYLIVRGLQRYRYTEDAEALRERTVEAITNWYEKSGCMYEYYDCDDEIPPARLDRKGRLARGKGLPVIPDYHWTAALFLDLVMRPEL